MDDFISRQTAIDEWKNDFRGYVNALDLPKDDYKGIMEYIDELPSAQPDPNVLEQEYLKGWEDGRKNLLDAISGTLEDFCDKCGEGKKYNGVMCAACNLDSAISAVENILLEQEEEERRTDEQ